MMNRLEIHELPKGERHRFTNEFQPPLELIQALKAKSSGVDIRYDRYFKKYVLFEIHPQTGFLLDIKHYDLNKLGMYIADNMQPQYGDHKTKRLRARQLNEESQQREVHNKIEDLRKQVEENKKIWQDFDNEMDSYGNIYKRGNQNKEWMPFLQRVPNLG